MVLSNAQWFANPVTAAPAVDIDQSCRFNDDDSAYLARTPDASNRKTWTFSAWVKRANLFNDSVPQFILSAGDGGANDFVMYFLQENDTLRISDYESGTASNLITTQLFRDVGAWYHFVLAYDTTQGTAANRIKLYVNGSQVTDFGTETYPSENNDLVINSAIPHNIGRGAYSSNGYFSGYLTEIVFIDGTAYAASSFGETNSDTGQWTPTSVSGLTFGTNGYYLDFADSSSLGNDVSGNDNDFTSSGLAADDQVADTPTDNYCTLNYIRARSPSPNNLLTFANGNLSVISGTAWFTTYQGTIQIPESGKWYFEVSGVSTLGYVGIGVAASDEDPWQEATFWGWGDMPGYVYHSGYAGFAPNSTPGVVKVAVDMDNSKIWWGVDTGWMGTTSGNNDGDPAAGSNPTFDDVSGKLFPTGAVQNNTHSWNFGQLGFAQTPPTGFKGLYWSQLDDPTIADPSAYFQNTLYTGDGASSLAVNQGGNSTFEPDFVWIKNRDATDSHILTDSVRGATKVISSDSTAAETTDADTLLSFDSDGFSVGADVKVNTSTEKYVGWQWIEGATPGFDVVSFTGNATNRTISHSVGVTPEFIIVKNRADTDNWAVYHASNTAAPATDYLILNTTAATADDATIWNDTAPTSSVFSVGTSSLTNGNTEAMIAYLWAGVEGFSNFGSYEGNGNADGTFVFTGMKPALVICKSIDSTSDWFMFDNQRLGYNVDNNSLFSDTTAAELTADNIDILSNGFKLRIATDPNVAETYVYMAFAETPFKTANAR